MKVIFYTLDTFTSGTTIFTLLKKRFKLESANGNEKGNNVQLRYECYASAIKSVPSNTLSAHLYINGQRQNLAPLECIAVTHSFIIQNFAYFYLLDKITLLLFQARSKTIYTNGEIREKGFIKSKNGVKHSCRYFKKYRCDIA